MQNPRVSCTISYRGIDVGGDSDYHREKIDVSLTKTIDHIEGESAAKTKKRLHSLNATTTLLVADVENIISEKVKLLKRM